MLNRDIFLNISPLDHRYYISNKEYFDKLSQYISESANIRYCIKVEMALLVNHIKQFNPNEDTSSLDLVIQKISPEEVYREEKKTHHNIRALVNVIKNYIPKKWHRFVHLGATSVDILDTAFALSYRDAIINVVLPLLVDIEKKLIDIAKTESNTPQIGRTHGQHAIPITFGFAIAQYVSRLGKTITSIDKLVRGLRGKLSGAVGAYNAMQLITDNPIEFEKEFLCSLGLEPDDISTQLVQPEYFLRLLLEINTSFGIFANLADDLRNLQRTEIGEVREGFSKNQVGSSTMPQKRNPWNSEHIKSLWKAFSPRVLSFYMDQISEHQRDLTNSASRRFVADYIAGFTAAAARMKYVLSDLYVDRKRMQKNIHINGDLVLSEAIYILLANEGESEAHEIVRRLTLERERSGKKMWELINDKEELRNKLLHALKERGIKDPDDFWKKPESYSGLAYKKALEIAKHYEREIKKLISRTEESNY